MAKMWYSLVRFLFSPLIRLIWVRKVEGLENIPKKGAVIIASNHQSYFDFICFISVSPKKIYYLAAEKFYKSPLWRPLMKMTGQIKVERQAKDKMEAVNKADLILNKGKMLGIFPEGTRSADGEMHKPFSGVARFALKNRAPVVPVGIKGTYEILPRQKRLPKFKKITEIRIGRPMYFEEYYGKENDKVILEKITDKIMSEIAVLAGKEIMYRK